VRPAADKRDHGDDYGELTGRRPPGAEIRVVYERGKPRGLKFEAVTFEKAWSLY